MLFGEKHGYRSRAGRQAGRLSARLANYSETASSHWATCRRSIGGMACLLSSQPASSIQHPGIQLHDGEVCTCCRYSIYFCILATWTWCGYKRAGVVPFVSGNFKSPCILPGTPELPTLVLLPLLALPVPVQGGFAAAGPPFSPPIPTGPLDCHRLTVVWTHNYGKWIERYMQWPPSFAPFHVLHYQTCQVRLQLLQCIVTTPYGSYQYLLG